MNRQIPDKYNTIILMIKIYKDISFKFNQMLVVK